MRSGEPIPNARASFAVLTVSALGVVFGDIGTSPLYTLKECMMAAGGTKASVEDLYGVLSLMFWSLIMVVTVKYLAFVMCADNEGEGGIFALLAIIPQRFRAGPAESDKITAMALLAVIGAALLLGDGVITPAISVLSAVEGLAVASPRLSPMVVPLTCAILVVLFFIQQRGTGSVGKLFGPVMVVWFATLAGLGVYHIFQAPQILAALSPHFGVTFFQRNGIQGGLILGSVVLVVTGGEALYADMGHFGIRPIRTAWMGFVLPALTLGYLGQGALLLREPKAASNPFFALVPAGWPTYLLVALSSTATVIASQALISGAFSLTRQAMLLGYFPRVTVRHTAYHTEGQIYIPEVNVLLGIGCVLLVLVFRESVRLAAAYGIAVTGTMTITSVLYFMVTRYTWDWPLWKASLVLALFLSFDIPFLGANLFKFFEGGYIPMLIGAGLIAGMLIWSHGRTSLINRYSNRFSNFEKAWPQIKGWLCSRVPGTAVFLSPSSENVPLILMHYVEHCRSLHQTVVLLTVELPPVPVVQDGARYRVTTLGEGFYKLIVSFGYIEEPQLLPVLRTVSQREHLPVDTDETTYFIGRLTIISKHGGLQRVPEAIFAYLSRNAVRAERYFGMPSEQVVEIGTQVYL